MINTNTYIICSILNNKLSFIKCICLRDKTWLISRDLEGEAQLMALKTTNEIPPGCPDKPSI